MIVIFVFYDSPTHFLSRFTSKQFQHCDLYTYDGEYWLYYSLGLTGIKTRVYHNVEASKMVDAIKNNPSVTNLISIHVHEKHIFPWRPFYIATCNEICRHLSGVDFGISRNPGHLFGKLIKYGDSRNYEILTVWSRDVSH